MLHIVCTLRQSGVKPGCRRSGDDLVMRRRQADVLVARGLSGVLDLGVAGEVAAGGSTARKHGPRPGTWSRRFRAGAAAASMWETAPGQ